MPYGYIGQNLPNQTKANSGVFSISDVADLEKQGKFGGSLELIEEQSITSSTATMEFTNIQEAKYDVHLLQIDSFYATAQRNLLVRLSNDSGSSYISTGYQYAYQYGQANGSFGEDKSTNYNAMSLVTFGADTIQESQNTYIYFYNLGNSSKYSFSTFQNTGVQTGVYGMLFGGSVLPTAETHNAIQLLPTLSTNIANLQAKLYGVKQL
jgi:hypothetical protein